jgi:excisionase family DNA binding protein
MAKSPIPFHLRDAGSVQEAADHLGVSKPTLQTAINTGELPSFKIKRRRIVRREAVEGYSKKLEDKYSDALGGTAA